MDATHSFDGSVLATLQRVCAEHGASFFWAWPQGVVLGVAGAHIRASLPWDMGAYAALKAELQHHPHTVCGAAVRVETPLDAAAGNALVPVEGLSDLGARTLQAVWALRKNVLVLGPPLACRAWMQSWAERFAWGVWIGSHPPASLLCVATYEEAVALQPDRTTVYGAPSSVCAQALLQSSGVAVHVDADRLERGLMRIEWVLQEFLGRPPAALDVLNALDVVVCVGPLGHVEGVAELVWVAEGYRPQWVLLRGAHGTGDALLPCQPPTFYTQFARVGHGSLVDEWDSVKGVAHASEAGPVSQLTELEHVFTPAFEDPFEDVLPEPNKVAPSVPWVSPDPLENLDISVDDMSPVGWELEQPGSEEWIGQQQERAGYEAAQMAAHFGLGPPPPKKE